VAIGGLVASAIDGLPFAYDATPNAERRHTQLFDVEETPNLVATNHILMIGVSGTL
jgi:hypothetical protein